MISSRGPAVEDMRLRYRVLDADDLDTLTEGALSLAPDDHGRIRAVWRATGGLDELESTILDERFGTLWWRSRYPDTGYDFVGERRGDTIVVEGLFEGRPLRRELEIDHRPFHFDWKLGLVGFVRSGAAKQQFWVLRPDKQTVHVFEARRMEEELITVSGLDVEAVRVNWGLTGILRPFYNGDMWFRLDDGAFLTGEHAGRVVELIPG